MPRRLAVAAPTDGGRHRDIRDRLVAPDAHHPVLRDKPDRAFVREAARAPRGPVHPRPSARPGSRRPCPRCHRPTGPGRASSTCRVAVQAKQTWPAPRPSRAAASCGAAPSTAAPPWCRPRSRSGCAALAPLRSRMRGRADARGTRGGGGPGRPRHRCGNGGPETGPAPPRPPARRSRGRSLAGDPLSCHRCLAGPWRHARGTGRVVA